MSTRALRRLQREHEESRLLAISKPENAHEDALDSDRDAVSSTGTPKSKRKKKKKANTFETLNQAVEEEDSVESTASDNEEAHPQSNNHEHPTLQHMTPKKKRKRKQNAKSTAKISSLAKHAKAENNGNDKSEVDEIDRALRELSLGKTSPLSREDGYSHQDGHESHGSWGKTFSNLLSIDTKNLNPTNEMRSLFGRIVLEPATRNQVPDEGGRLDLETALNGRHSPASKGKELGSFAKRRNILMQGRESWPLASSGGLGMEVVEDAEEELDSAAHSTAFGKQYRIIHNAVYRETQYQFKQAVESMSAENMIHLLVYNPYHIATLLQVAEIAKHQGDHSVTGDLLERALFAVGRSVHSTFGVSVREGLARLKFDEAPSREMYLAIWRYIQNLEMRGTWRTAFEWGKMLLSFNVLSDPYGITHVLDQYALRGRQHDALIMLCSQDHFGETWSHLPNMQISLALAYHRAGQPKLARRTLALATHRYPYILSHLCSTLEVSPLPKSLWGITPSTDAEKLYSELYVIRAKDLWATPEAKALLVEVADTLDSYSAHIKDKPPAPKLDISLEDARHVLLLDIPALIALVPRKFRSLPTAQYDVLPPPSSAADVGLTARAPTDVPEQGGPMGRFLRDLVRAASSGFLGGSTAEPSTSTDDENRNDIVEAAETAGPRAHNEQQAIQEQDLFNTTLAHLDVSEADRVAILAALDESGNSDSEPDVDLNPPPHLQAHPPPPPPPEQQRQQRQSYDGRTLPNLPSVEDDSEPEDQPPPPPPQDQDQPTPPAVVLTPDPQRIQRLLLTTALADLQSNQPGAMDTYLSQLRQLRPREREWTLGMVAQRLQTTERRKKGGEGVESDDTGIGAADAADDAADADEGRGGDREGDLVMRIRRAMG